jgi:predicted transcriptional regulator of viral defense system
MSSFVAKTLADHPEQVHTLSMGATTTSPQFYTASVRQRIEKGGERVWRLEDFRDLPFAAVAQALSRLTRAGTLERLSKGIYYLRYARQQASCRS